jgi:hypothetical protein
MNKWLILVVLVLLVLTGAMGLKAVSSGSASKLVSSTTLPPPSTLPGGPSGGAVLVASTTLPPPSTLPGGPQN